MMMRRVLGASSAAAAAAAAAGVVVAQQRRTVISIKGEQEDRIYKMYPRKSGKELDEELQAKVDQKKRFTAPKNKKEALEHLTYGCDYENKSDMQRSANDIMSVNDQNTVYVEDMAYNYQRVFPAFNSSKTRWHEGGGSYEYQKVHPKT